MFVKDWYQSACAIVFQPHDSHQRMIVGTGNLIGNNSVRTARHVFDNGNGTYFCRFFHFDNTENESIDRPIKGGAMFANHGVNLAYTQLEPLPKDIFQKYCKVINAVKEDQHPEGHVVLFHFANAQFNVSVGYVEADQCFSFQQRVFAAVGKGASGAGLLWQQLDGSASITNCECRRDAVRI